MDLDQEFIELYEGWKKGKYTIKDKSGKILGTYNSGGKAQKAMDDLMQKGDYDKLEVSLVEAKIKHECPKCKGKGCEHCDGKGYHIEDEDDDPVGKNESTIKEAFWKVVVPDMPPVFVEAGSAAEIKASMRKKLKGEAFKELVIDRVSKAEMVKKYRELAKGKGDDDEEETSESVIEAVNLKQLRKQYDKNEDENKHTENYLLLAKAFGSKSEVKKVQDIMKRNEKQGHTSKSDMDWMYKNINPYYNKIRNEETMKLEDVVKNILEGKPIDELSADLLKRAREKAFRKRDDDKQTKSGMSGKYVGQRQANKFGAGAKRAETGIKSQGDAMRYYRDKKRAPSGWRVISTPNGKKVVREDTDPNTPGTQGDKAEYEAKRKKIAKKFGVNSCSELEGDKKKACYAALDKAHVADHEEQVELKNMKKEDSQKFSKLFSHVKNMMKEKKKKMLKGYTSNY